MSWSGLVESGQVTIFLVISGQIGSHQVGSQKTDPWTSLAVIIQGGSKKVRCCTVSTAYFF